MMSLPINIKSGSSSLIFGITMYRNRGSFGDKIIAQIGYALAFVAAAVESAVALTFTALSLLTYPFSSTPFKSSLNWLDSTVFALGWSAVDFALNPFYRILVCDEKSARKILDSGDLGTTPSGAFI